MWAIFFHVICGMYRCSIVAMPVLGGVKMVTIIFIVHSYDYDDLRLLIIIMRNE